MNECQIKTFEGLSTTFKASTNLFWHRFAYSIFVLKYYLNESCCNYSQVILIQLLQSTQVPRLNLFLPYMVNYKYLNDAFNIQKLEPLESITFIYALIHMHVRYINLVYMCNMYNNCDWILENRPNYHTAPIPFYWPS